MHWAFEVQLKSMRVAEFCIKNCLIIPLRASKSYFYIKTHCCCILCSPSRAPPNTQSVLKMSTPSCSDSGVWRMTSCKRPVGDLLGEVNWAQLHLAVLTVSSVVSKLGPGSERDGSDPSAAWVTSLQKGLSVLSFPLYTETHTHIVLILKD